MAFVPYMVGGFAVDKLMGGNGLKGAALGGLGGAFAPGMLASGAAEVAAVPAMQASTGISLEALAAADPMALGLGDIAVTGAAPYAPYGIELGTTLADPMALNIGQLSATGATNSAAMLDPYTLLGNVSSPNLINNPSLLSQAGDWAVQKGADVTKYIDSGWDDMSNSDKAQTLTGVVGAVDSATQPPPPIQAPPIRQVVAKAPSPREPFVTQIQIPGGIPVASISEEDRRKANRYSSLLG